jgi:hypothetical protein
VDTNADRKLDALVLLKLDIEWLHRIEQIKSRSDGPLRILFVGLGITEIDKQSIAEILRDIAIIMRDDLGSGLLIGLDDVMEIFGIELGGELGRAHQVAEHHRELAAFGAWNLQGRRRCSLGRLLLVDLRGWHRG